MLLPALRISPTLPILLATHILIPIIAGDIPPDLRDIYAGGVLFALGKGEKPGIRPIGNGDLFRKLASRLILRPHRRVLADYFMDTYDNYKQFAIGVVGGVEKMFQAATLLAGEPPPPTSPPADPAESVMCVIQIDARNAYCTANRQGFFDTLAGRSSAACSAAGIRKGDALPSPPLAVANKFLCSVYGGPSTFIHHTKDFETHEIDNTDGFHQGDAMGSFGYAVATFPFIGEALKMDTTVLGFSLVDNTCLVGPLSNAWAMYDRVRRVMLDLNLTLNQKECDLWVPQWAHLAAPPAILETIQARHPESRLQYKQRGFPLLGLPLGTADFAKHHLAGVSDRIVKTLLPLSRLHDGRIFTQIMLSCVNLRPLYYVRNLPPSISHDFATTCDTAIMDAFAAYLSFPSDWRADPRYIRASAQLRLGTKKGGIGLTAAAAVLHSSFFASCSQGLLCVGSTSLHAYANRDSLSVNNPSSSEHSFLKGFTDCRNQLAACGAVKQEDVGAATPEKAVILPSAASLLPLRPYTHTDPPPTLPPPQRRLSKLVRDNDPSYSPSHATAGGTPYDTARVAHLSSSTIKAKDSSSALASLLAKDGSDLSQSPLSWLRVVPGSPTFDAFPKPQFVVFLLLVLGLPIPAPPNTSVVCQCGVLFDPGGHHRMTCKKWLSGAATSGHDHAVHSLRDLSRSCRVGCSTSPHSIPTHSGRRQGDLGFDINVGPGATQLIADLTFCHPVRGSPTAPQHFNTVGTWLPNALRDRATTKRNKHRDGYAQQQLSFMGLAATTFGVLDADFLRLLWVLAARHTSEDMQIGEVRDFGTSFAVPRQAVFYKLRSRMAVAAALATAQRLLSMKRVFTYSPPSLSYDPSDPSFSLPTSVSALPLGPIDSVA